MITEDIINSLAIEVQKIKLQYMNQIDSEMSRDLNEKDQKIFKLSHEVEILDEMIQHIFSKLRELIKN